MAFFNRTKPCASHLHSKQPHRKLLMNTQIQILDCIDIGANLTNKQYTHDVEQVIQSARDAGLSQIILTGSSLRNSRQSADLCELHSHYLYSTAGIHPHDAKTFDSSTTPTELRRLYELDQVVAVGECGLDFNRDFSPRDQQRNCFAAHLELAAENQLPLFLHERDAHEELVTMLKDARDSISGGVVHCFTGTEDEARAYLDLDLHLGITGWICDERRGKHLRDVVKLIPVEKLMIETDAPYLAPRDFRPKIRRNEPKYLPHILQTVADCRGENVIELGAKIIETTKQFFEIKSVNNST